MNLFSKNNPYWDPLRSLLSSQEDLEQKIDAIRIFKKEQTQPLQDKFLNGKLMLVKLMESLSHLADAILVQTYEMARETLRPILGTSRFKDNDGNFLPGEFAIIGMGKLGGRELHFASDLDVIFIYNRNGETFGAKNVTNQEYYAKITQRIIGYLTLYTRYGYAYKVDTELRPSGRAGALVAPLDPWTTYYHEMGQIWERQALLKARLIHATGEFGKDFTGLFNRLTFLKPFPELLSSEIHHLRARIEKELANESNQRWHFKKGYGGLVDIEFLVQYLQLKLGKIYEDLLTPNTFEALERLAKREVVSKNNIKILKKAYEFYRTLEIQLALRLQWPEGFLNPHGERIPQLAEWMHFKNADDFLGKFSFFRENVRRIYLETLKLEEA